MAKDQENKGNYMMQGGDSIGSVQIADDVIATIVGLAATEVEGIAYMQGNLTNEVVGKLGVKNLSKGMKISVENHAVSAELSVIMDYGYSIPKVTKAVQDKIKAAVENMLGLTVETINLHIVGVNMENA